MTVEELTDYGMARMDEGEIRGFLSSQNVGVLGLPTESVPCLRPLSFEFDGESRLYLLYVLGSRSRKEELSKRTDVARFLVYSAETMFNWRSVLLTGTLSEVPEGERETVHATVELAWRPDLFERASTSMDTKLYQFQIEDQAGIKHMGLPPAFEAEPTESSRE